MPDEKTPRPFWSGTLAFGLVNVPVGLYPAVRSAGTSLRMVDSDGTPLARRYVCPAEEREVSRDELVRGYEVEEGRYVVVSEDELEALEPEKSREIDLRRFVPVDDLDPVFFDRGYILTPVGDSTRAYRLLAESMERGGRAGLATFVMRAKEYLVAILARDGVLRAETLRFDDDEIRTAEGVGMPEPAPPGDGLAETLADFMTEAREDDIDTDELEDRSAEQLHALVARRLESGEGVHAPAPDEQAAADARTADIVDLMAVLRKSLEADS